MKATIARYGAQASKYKVADLSWREAFYQSATVERVRLGGPLVVPVLVVASPVCVDARGGAEPLSCVAAVEQALEAAVAAGLLRDRRDVVEVRLHRIMVDGRDGLGVALMDASEPF